MNKINPGRRGKPEIETLTAIHRTKPRAPFTAGEKARALILYAGVDPSATGMLLNAPGESGLRRGSLATTRGWNRRVPKQDAPGAAISAGSAAKTFPLHTLNRPLPSFMCREPRGHGHSTNESARRHLWRARRGASWDPSTVMTSPFRTATGSILSWRQPPLHHQRQRGPCPFLRDFTQAFAGLNLYLPRGHRISARTARGRRTIPLPLALLAGLLLHAGNQLRPGSRQPFLRRRPTRVPYYRSLRSPLGCPSTHNGPVVSSDSFPPATS